jgi:NADH-quinone oxidoreductase subunit G
MCLVEMSNAPMGKLMPGCQMPMAEGVTVKTDTPRVKDQQRAVLEFILLNHPVDCSICDQAGECKLQDYYMKFDRQPSRLDMPKVKKGKRVALGPLVVIDQERCILCTRCVRFMREVAKAPQLGVAERGNESFITTFPGQPLDSKYSGNVVDICPVGALTSTDFRFRGRVWFMSSARSVCTGCARGCNTFLDYLSDTTYRYRPRENEAVNQEWMCDDGRLTYKPLNLGRVLEARVGRTSQGAPAAQQAALASAAQVLDRHAKAGTLGVLLSPTASLEDLLVAATVAKDVLGAQEVFAGGRADGWQDDFLKRADQNPNRKGLELVAQALGLAVRPAADLAAAVAAGKVKGVWAVGAETPDAAVAAKIAQAEDLVVQATNEGPLAAGSTVLLPAAPHSEVDGTFVNFEGKAQRFEMAYFPRGQARPHWALAAALGASLGAKLAFASGREVFAALGPKLGAALGDFKWDSLASIGKRFGIVPLAAGTVDGRLAPNRDRTPSETGEDYRRAMARTS